MERNDKMHFINAYDHAAQKMHQVLCSLGCTYTVSQKKWDTVFVSTYSSNIQWILKTSFTGTLTL